MIKIKRSIIRILAVLLALAPIASSRSVDAQAPGAQPFTSLATPFTQDLYGASNNILYFPDYGGILGGVAFAPNGDVWSSECLFYGTRMHRFHKDSTVTVHGTTVHQETVVDISDIGPYGSGALPNGAGGCGIVNHPDGFIYANSMFGIWKLDASTGLPVDPNNNDQPIAANDPAPAGGGLVGGASAQAGNALGISVDPQADAAGVHHIVYVGADCHPSLSHDARTCTFFDLNPATGATTVFARLTRSAEALVDGVYFDPSGNYLFAAHRDEDEASPQNSLQVIHRPAALKALNAAADDTQLAQNVIMASEPDGVAFHATQGFVVTLNESDDGPVKAGTMTRFDFPNGDFSLPPVQTEFASGGFRGDLLQVGPDGCIYATQGEMLDHLGDVADPLYGVGTRYLDGTLSQENSIVRICGGFATPPMANENGQQTGTINGTIYVDVNRNGQFDTDEPRIPGVTVTLGGGSTATAVSGPDGTYSFPSLNPGSYAVSSPAAAEGLQLFTPSPLPVTVAAGQDTNGVDFGYVPGSVSGWAYVDVNRNGTRDAGESGIADVPISLAGPTAAMTMTAADGSYSFTMVLAGNYSDSAPASAAGKALATASPLTFALAAAEDKTDQNFGYVPGELSGFAYVDSNRNSVKDASEAGIANVTITGPGSTTTTAADGSYSFTNLDAGSYSVNAPATASGKALFTASSLNVTVNAGATTPNNNFGYVTGGLSGFAYVDSNRNSVKDASEAGIANVTITGPGGTTTTAADGSYSFTNLDAGSYNVSAPATASGKALFTASSLNVTVNAGAATPNNNFGYVTGSLSGFAYVDSNRNSVKDASEAGIANVTITGPGGTTTTAADGSYSFTNLDAGNYSVSAPATASGKALFTASSLNVTVNAGATTPNNNFGYVTGGLSGFAYVDNNRNSVKDASEAGIANVTITGPGGTTTTAADGSYSFTNLDAGSYSVSAPATASGKALFTASSLNVTVNAGATTPNNNFGYVTGGLSGFAYVDNNRNSVKDAGEAGLANVVISGPAGTTTTAADGSYSFTNLDAGSYSVSAPATASGKARFTASPLSVSVAAGATTPNNNFGYVTGGLSGFAYVDSNRNSVKDAGEAGLGNVTITGPGGTTTTAADGSYSFTNLDAGSYSVSAPATASGKARFTASPLSVSVAAGATTPNVNFGYVQGGLSGFVYVDSNRNLVRDAGEPGIAGVVVTGPGGTRTTAADGSYSFTNLDAGAYSVSSPATASGYGLETPSPLSPAVTAGATTTNVNFGYVSGTITGVVFDDVNENGVQDAGEPPISGVTITLSNGSTTTSGTNGTFTFTNVPAGTYTLTAPAVYNNTGRVSVGSVTVTVPAGGTVSGVKFRYHGRPFVTYTIGGWGAKASGNNGGALLVNNFTAVYGTAGVTIGGAPYYLKFTNAAAVQAFLKNSGGTPGPLTASATNPTNSSSGNFGDQVLALKLSVDFSNKGITTAGFGARHIASGQPLAGWTVSQVLTMAMQVLAGNASAVPSGMSVGTLTTLLSSLNTNYDAGVLNNDVCTK